MSGQVTFSEEQVMRIVCSKLVEALAPQRTPQAFFDAMAWPVHVLDVSISAERQEQTVARGLQCAADCFACCEKMPVVTLPAFLVLAWMWFHGSGAAAAGTLDAAGDVGCAFFVGRRCSVYPFRPSVCRIFHSIDRADCEAGRFSQDKVVRLAPPLVTGVLRGVQAGLEQLGIENRPIILNAGVRTLAQGGGAVTRWLSGETVFAPIA